MFSSDKHNVIGKIESTNPKVVSPLKHGVFELYSVNF